MRSSAVPNRRAEPEDPHVRIPLDLVRNCADLSDSEYRLLTVIMSHDWTTNDAGCTASQATLAREARSSESTVKRGLKKLAALGYIFEPAPQYRNGAQIGTVIRVTGKVRKGRSLTTAVKAQPIQQHFSGGSTVDPPKTTPRRGFANKPEPDVERVPLIAEDHKRITQLEAWGCPDAADYLGLMLGLLIQRERELGRTDSSPARLREIYDGAARSRALRKEGVTAPFALLLAGIKRRFLLARPRYGTLEDLAPGARDHARFLIGRAVDGKPVADEMLADIGLSRQAFNEAVSIERERSDAEEDEAAEATLEADAESTQERQDGGAAGGERELMDRLAQTVDVPAYEMFVRRTQFTVDGNTVAMRPTTRFAADYLRKNVVALLHGWGYTPEIIDAPDSRRAADA